MVVSPPSSKAAAPTAMAFIPLFRRLTSAPDSPKRLRFMSPITPPGAEPALAVELVWLAWLPGLASLLLLA